MCSVNTIECALELRLCKAELVIARRSLHAILCDLLCMLGASNIDILSPFAGLHQDNGLFLRYLYDTAGSRRTAELTVDHHPHLPYAKRCTIRLMPIKDTDISNGGAGDYLLRVQTACAEDEPPVYDDALFLSSGEQQLVVKTFPFPAPRFLPGSPYAGCAVRLTLFKRRLHRGTFFPGSRCDEQTVSCGYSGRPADYDLPLLSEECADPNALLARLSPMRLPGLRLDAPAPDLFYRKMTLSGIGVFHPVATDALRERLSRHACVSFGDAPMPRMRSLPLLDAWQLCGLTACLRTPPADMSPAELLLEAAGKPLDPQSPDVAAVLLWLRAVRVRLSAEAARQGRFSGSLCAPGVWQDEDVYAALQTALAPTHISALPLRGAWFAGSRFSASIRAFVEPEKSADD